MITNDNKCEQMITNVYKYYDNFSYQNYQMITNVNNC